MHRLVYLSDAVGEVDATALAEIAGAARDLTDRLGITGLLLFHEGRFFHELEGTRTAVLIAFERIRSDPRHRNVQVIEFGPATAPAFDHWAMAMGHPERLPDALRLRAFSIFDLIPRDAEARGARPKVRAAVRKFLAGFENFVPEA